MDPKVRTAPTIAPASLKLGLPEKNIIHRAAKAGSIIVIINLPVTTVSIGEIPVKYLKY
jgi:hypothetical protein